MLIGLTGSARCGKDTIAEELSKNYGFFKIAFADPLKQMVGALLSMKPPVLEEFKDKELAFLDGVTPRRLLQTLGTEWGRQIIMDDIWLRFAQEKIDICRAQAFNDIVITDVRFDNEAEFIQKQGGVVFRVIRPDAPKVHAHASEAGVKQTLTNGHIYNTGTLEELYELIPEWLTLLRQSES